MFLADLSELGKQAFLGLCRVMIDADNVAAPEELRMLEEVCVEMGVGDPDGETSDSVADLCGNVSDHRERAFVLLELASLARIDHSYAAAERQLLRSIASAWSIDPLTVIRIEAWAEKRVQLSREAAEVVSEIVYPVG